MIGSSTTDPCSSPHRQEADGHIHAHAAIAVKSESGQKLHPSRETFSQWRAWMPSTPKPRRPEDGDVGALSEPRRRAMVRKTRRLLPRPSASAPRQGSARPCLRGRSCQSRAGSIGLAGRIQVARANPIRLPVTPAARRAVGEGLVAWKAVATAQPENGMAQSMVERLSMAQVVGAILHAIGRRRSINSPGRTPIWASPPDGSDLRHMNEAVSRTSELLDGDEETIPGSVAQYLETLANRVDLQRAQERVQHR